MSRLREAGKSLNLSALEFSHLKKKNQNNMSSLRKLW